MFVIQRPKTPPKNQEASYLTEAGPAVHPRFRGFSLVSDHSCQLLTVMSRSLTGDMLFDWETIWITFASFPKQCKGMFKSTSSQVSHWPSENSSLPSQTFQPSWERGGAVQIFSQTIINGLDPLGMNASRNSTGLLRTLRWEKLVQVQRQLISTVH